jgi:hypothetical protein
MGGCVNPFVFAADSIRLSRKITDHLIDGREYLPFEGLLLAQFGTSGYSRSPLYLRHYGVDVLDDANMTLHREVIRPVFLHRVRNRTVIGACGHRADAGNPLKIASRLFYSYMKIMEEIPKGFWDTACLQVQRMLPYSVELYNQGEIVRLSKRRRLSYTQTFLSYCQGETCAEERVIRALSYFQAKVREVANAEGIEEWDAIFDQVASDLYLREFYMHANGETPFHPFLPEKEYQRSFDNLIGAFESEFSKVSHGKPSSKNPYWDDEVEELDEVN